MDVFGPIADNAGGIVEMSDQPESVRAVTDSLDAVGNTTKATTKGYAIGSAGLASFLLFSAYLDEVATFTGAPFAVVDIAAPEVFVGGLLGAALVSLFAAWACAAVGRSAAAVVAEVRRQVRRGGEVFFFFSDHSPTTPPPSPPPVCGAPGYHGGLGKARLRAVSEERELGLG